MNGTQLQYVTLTAYVLLAIVSVTAMRRRAVWPWAAARAVVGDEQYIVLSVLPGAE